MSNDTFNFQGLPPEINSARILLRPAAQAQEYRRHLAPPAACLPHVVRIPLAEVALAFLIEEGLAKRDFPRKPPGSVHGPND